jgi:hypothetical protein
MNYRIIVLYLVFSQPAGGQHKVRRDECHDGDKIAASVLERTIVQIDADVNVDDWITSLMMSRQLATSRNLNDIVEHNGSNDLSDIHKKAFWQPSAGRPVPVDTRLSSPTLTGRVVTVRPELFGSQVDYVDSSGIKAMRYGKRSAGKPL